MKKQGWIICALVIFALGAALGDRCYGDAAADFQRGTELLEQGDFDGALQAYGKAAKADPDKGQYAQAFMLLRQVVLMRERLATTTDDNQWNRYARSLHAFYAQQHLYDALLDIDRQIHKRFGTASTATLLAETLLARDRAAEAAEVLDGVPALRATTSTRALKALALTKTGETEKAKAVADEIWVDAQTGPGALYRVARVQAALGNKQAAVSNLVRCFETSPPGALAGFKSHAQSASEFAEIASSEEFTKALQTESQVKQSSCSGGGNCANCPFQGQCGGE